jgi:hypothetical protein
MRVYNKDVQALYCGREKKFMASELPPLYYQVSFQPLWPMSTRETCDVVITLNRMNRQLDEDIMRTASPGGGGGGGVISRWRCEEDRFKGLLSVVSA